MSNLFKKSFDKVRTVLGLKKKPRTAAADPKFGKTRDLTDEEIADISGQTPEKRRRSRAGGGYVNTPLGNPSERLGP